MLAATLISIHNIFTLVELMRRIRRSILGNCFDQYALEMTKLMEKPAD
jgi:tRNA-guanine family transglycosylase